MAALVVVMAATQAGCFTAAFDARQQTALQKFGYDKVVLTDQISALAVVRHGSGNPQYMFLGKQHSYVVTRGGAELVRIAQSPIAKQVEIFQASAPGSRLSLSGNDFSGDIVLTAWLKNQDYPPRSVEALGFVPDKSAGGLPQGPTRFTRYSLTVPVAGYVGKPVALAEGSNLSHPIAISFWPAGPNPVPRRRAAHAGAVALDVITAPVVVLGVLGAVTIIGIGCSLSRSDQPCIE
ncbi:MAG TPA: hypothetical protein VF292_14195 [Rhodanobacteraceae bacterium]